MGKVELRGVSKVYDSKVKEKKRSLFKRNSKEQSTTHTPKAVDNISVTIPDGSFTVIVGPSGCGKSTTLRMIAGLEEISDGEVLIGEKVVNDLSPGDRNISMVFQSYALYPMMTVRQNITFGLENNRAEKNEIEKRLTEVSSIVGLENFLDRRPAQLSGGQRQRVALARAIAKHPQLYIFDEPLSNLDAKLRSEMRSELINMHNQLKTTLIYVTHDQVEAMTMADQIILMNNGEIMQVGSPDEIYNDPQNIFVAEFIGTPAMNIIKNQQAEGYWGFRPEVGNLTNEMEDLTDFVSFNGEIITKENLGAEAIYLIDGEHGRVRIKSNDLSFDMGDQIFVNIHKDKIYHFNEDGTRAYKTEKSI